jgi:dTDP-4-dehydrorhamnose reductase
MRVAVTGAGGRLGTALLARLAALETSGVVEEVLAWDLPEHDLDDPASAERLVGAHRPDLVLHTAAWIDVDGCARDPELAMRRNGVATGELARALAARGAAMIAISTNEVFDGRRTDGRGYEPTDIANPGNAYGRSKLEGERLAREAFDATGPEFERAATADPESNVPDRRAPALAIVRTSWLFGPPGADFPKKILAAALRARDADEPLSLVDDEFGCPTYSFDLAEAIARMVAAEAARATGEIRGIHHVTNSGHASRAQWAREVLRLAAVEVPTRDVPLSTWPRPSTPPAWGVLAPTRLPGGPLWSWQAATAHYVEWIMEEERRS